MRPTPLPSGQWVGEERKRKKMPMSKMMRLVCHARRSFTGQCDTIAWSFIWARLVPNKAWMPEGCGVMLPTCDLLCWWPWVRYTTYWYGAVCAEPSVPTAGTYQGRVSSLSTVDYGLCRG